MTHDIEALAYHVSYASDAGNGGGSGGTQTEWSGDVEATPVRGRVDFSGVSGNSVFGSGDYALFDSAGAIIVKPQSKTIIDVAPSARTAEIAAQYRTAVKDLEWTVEVLKDDAIIAGYHTVHCRATASHRLEISTPTAAFRSLHRVPQPTAITIIDYWYAKVDGLPANPITPFMLPGLTKSLGAPELVSMWASIAAQLEHLGEPIQLHSSVTVKTGDIEQVTRFGGVVSSIRRIRIDPWALTAPADFVASESDDTDRRRWRNPPAA